MSHPILRNVSPNHWHKGVVTVINLRHHRTNNVEVSQEKKKTSKVLSGIWLIVCAILFMAHSVFITEKYLEFDTTTEVKTSFSRNFSPPVVSFCRHLLELVHITSTNYAACNRKQFSDTCRMSFYENHSLEEVMKTKTKSLRDMVINTADGPKEYTTEKDAAMIDTLTQEYYKSYLKCIKITREEAFIDFFETTGWNEARLKTVMKTTLNISDIQVNSRNGQGFMFYKPFVGIIFHSYHSLPHYPDYDIYWYDYDRKESRNSYQFSFDSQFYYLLRSPYASQCVNYKDIVFEDDDHKTIQFVSKGHCLETCIRKKVYQKSGVRNGFFTTSSFNSKEGVTPDHKTINFDSEIHDYCFEMCHNECLTAYYLPVLMNRYESLHEDRFGIRIEMYRPQTEIRFTPIFPLDSYLIFLGSIAGLWFGWCIHSTAESVLKATFARIINC